MRRKSLPVFVEHISYFKTLVVFRQDTTIPIKMLKIHMKSIMFTITVTDMFSYIQQVHVCIYSAPKM